jgi:hypothetical protein
VRAAIAIDALSVAAANIVTPGPSGGTALGVVTGARAAEAVATDRVMGIAALAVAFQAGTIAARHRSRLWRKWRSGVAAPGCVRITHDRTRSHDAAEPK